MAKVIVGVFLLILILSGLLFYFFLYNPAKTPAPVKILPVQEQTNTQNIKNEDRASLSIYINNIQVPTSSREFLNRSIDVYLTQEISIIHIANPEVSWDDFFKTLPVTVSKNCFVTQSSVSYCSGDNGVLKFYLNGEKKDNLLSLKIKDGDRSLVTFGKESENQIKDQMSYVPNPLP